MVRNPPAIRAMQVWSVVWEDPLKEGMATDSNILAWRTPWTEEPARLQSTGSQRVGYDLATKQTTAYTHTHTLSLCHILFHYVSWQNIEYISLYSRTLLICPTCNSLHLLTPNLPQPPSPALPSRLTTTSLLFMPASLFLFCK